MQMGVKSAVITHWNEAVSAVINKRLDTLLKLHSKRFLSSKIQTQPCSQFYYLP